MEVSDISGEQCLLCGALGAEEFYKGRYRSYLICRTCNLVFVPPIYYLSAEDEKSRYELHQNFPDNKDYRKFLSRVFEPMKDFLSPDSRGLDFGSGKGPTLSVMFEEIGHTVAVYDCFYANDIRVFDNEYDFITATEVAEHLHNPGMELDRLWSCLRVGGG